MPLVQCLPHYYMLSPLLDCRFPDGIILTPHLLVNRSPICSWKRKPFSLPLHVVLSAQDAQYCHSPPVITWSVGLMTKPTKRLSWENCWKIEPESWLYSIRSGPNFGLLVIWSDKFLYCLIHLSWCFLLLPAQSILMIYAFKCECICVYVYVCKVCVCMQDSVCLFTFMTEIPSCLYSPQCQTLCIAHKNSQ